MGPSAVGIPHRSAQGLELAVQQCTSYSGLCKVRGTLWADFTPPGLRKRMPTGRQRLSPALKPCCRGAVYRARPKEHLSTMEFPLSEGTSLPGWSMFLCSTWLTERQGHWWQRWNAWPWKASLVFFEAQKQLPCTEDAQPCEAVT